MFSWSPWFIGNRCGRSGRKPMKANYVKETEWRMEGNWKNTGRKLKGEWKEIGRIMEGNWKENERKMRATWEENESSCRSRCWRTGVWALLPFDVVRYVVRTSASILADFNMSEVFLGLVWGWYHHKAVKKRWKQLVLWSGMIRFMWYLHWCCESSASQSQYDLIVFREV